MSTPPVPRPLRRGVGFTLIELLVVIAIIAILTAIIFPVFATLRENARQKTSMANMHEIQTGLAQFKLDQGRSPDVLFGYPYPVSPATTPATFVSMDKALAQAQADGLAQSKNIAAQYFPGLYPEYINDVQTFTDANNAVTDKTRVSVPLSVNKVGPVSATSATTYALVTPAPQNEYYLADAYDISPQIGGNNAFVGGNSNPSTYVVRYQPSWTEISANASNLYDSQTPTPAGKTFVNYTRQLRWTTPPADAYVTATTYHVPNSNKVLVLWESGDAKAIDASRFLAGAAGGCTGTDSPSASGGLFWQVSPTDPANPGHGTSANCP